MRRLLSMRSGLRVISAVASSVACLALAGCGVGATDRNAEAAPSSTDASATASSAATPSTGPSVTESASAPGEASASPQGDPVGGSSVILGPRTLEVRNVTAAPLTIKITDVDNYDWGQERAPDGRPDHAFPNGVQGYRLEPYESVAVSLYKNPDTGGAPFTMSLFNSAVSTTNPVLKVRMLPMKCIVGGKSDNTCYWGWRPWNSEPAFSTVDAQGDPVTGKASLTYLSDELVTRVNLRQDGEAKGAAGEDPGVLTSSGNGDEPAQSAVGAARGMHPTTITNDSDLTLTFKASGINPDGHQSGRARPDQPYPSGFQDMVLRPGESGTVAIWPDLTNWAMGGDSERSDFTLTAYSDGKQVLSKRIKARLGGTNYELVTGFDWGGVGSFMDRRYVDFTDAAADKERLFLWSYGQADGGRTGQCDGVHWCIPRELRIEQRN